MKFAQICLYCTLIIFFISVLQVSFASDSNKEFIEIKTIEDLNKISENSNGFFKLMNDLDFSNISNSLNKTEYSGFAVEEFSGIFDGNNNTIYNYSATSDIDYTASFFKEIKENGVVQNLYLENTTVNGGQYAASLASLNRGRIENCRSFNVSSSANMWASGLVGTNMPGGIITNCTVLGTVNGNQAGGITSTNSGIIEKCNVNVSVNGLSVAGSITGGNFDNEIVNCMAEGTVTSPHAGGIAGGNYGGNINYCISKTAILGDNILAGGIVGLNKGNISNCVALNNCINGSKIISLNFNRENGPIIKFGQNSQVGYIAGGMDYDKLSKNSFGWNGISTNKIRLSGDNGEKIMTGQIWNTFPNAIWVGWDTDVWKLGEDGLPALKENE
ncbi:hypothetical protein MmiHf6_00110 [Methanimicrococcus hongohii]|uniref:GLUG domain-containing protein n=1 Tax=Methanimicrococcus hongohii TaxID=3028295 RepID=A0AA96V731_9EURY|nr:hypothetical protein [Methanimicrococcus sp. Hf6]WNY22726.1 hypothetical protein MmiHf6_00110 [Methanimicrococcus sp. Hf6]